MSLQVFSIYEACGGNIGKMLGHERVVRKSEEMAARASKMFTKGDLLDKLHGDEKRADELFSRRCKEGNWMWHPDFPNDKDIGDFGTSWQMQLQMDTPSPHVRYMADVLMDLVKCTLSYVSCVIMLGSIGCGQRMTCMTCIACVRIQ